MTVAIPRPGVQVSVEFVSASPVTREPQLPPSCLVAPCYKVLDAFDSEGDVNSSARAGAYQNNAGKMAYAFPDYPDGGVLDDDSIRVYLQSGSSANRLKGADDEVILQNGAGAGWSYVASTKRLTLTSGLVDTLGAEAGDVVRLTMPTSGGPLPSGTEYDVVIAAVVGDTVVEIEAAQDWGFNVTATGKTYKVIRDAEQYTACGSGGEATSTLRVLNQDAPANGLAFTAGTAGAVGDLVQVTFVSGAALSVAITGSAAGWFVTTTYIPATTTWAQAVAAIQEANDSLEEGSRPLATDTGVVAIGTSSEAMPAVAKLMAAGDTDADGVFQLDGGTDENSVLLDADLLYTLYNIPKTSSVTGYALVQYRALRVDVSAAAEEPAVLSFSTRTEMIASIGPVDTRNPLALMFEKAFDNAPTTRIVGIGLSETSTEFPDGTPAAYSEAFDLLSSYRLYAVAVLSQAPQVHQKLLTHVLALSTAAEKSERVGFFSSALPSNAADEVLASGTDNGEVLEDDGDYTFVSGDQFDDLGVEADDVLVIAGQEGPYVLGNGLAGWHITSVTDEVLALDDEDAEGEATDTWPTVGEDYSWTVYGPGAAITSKDDKAQAIASYSEAFATRRMEHVIAPAVAITVDSVQHRLGGGYACAAVVGQIGAFKPSTPHTNWPLSGLDAIYGTSDYFSRSQLDLIAGGGSWILMQESNGGPTFTRHQLTTDVTTTELLEFSITKVLDYLSYFYRDVLRPFTGRFNITGGYIDAVNTQLEGYRAKHIQEQIVADVKMLDLRQSETAPTTLLVRIGVDFLYPGNYFEITLEA